MIERFKVIFERLPADGDPLFDDKHCLDSAERVPLDSVRRVGDFDVVVMLEVG
jgi:hypothetical protein